MLRHHVECSPSRFVRNEYQIAYVSYNCFILANGEKQDGSDSMPDADDKEYEIFKAARAHLDTSVFDAQEWENIVGKDLWRKTVFVLNRGGRFQNASKIYDGDKVANKYGKLVNMCQEKTAKVNSAMTGKAIPGYPIYIPAPLDLLGQPLPDAEQGFDLNLITYREIFQTKSRTTSNYWLLALFPENSVLMSAQDPAARGIRHDDKVRITSATNPTGEWDLKNGKRVPIVGKAKVIQGIRRGEISFPLVFGHFSYSGVDISIDGNTITGDPRRTRGFHANAAMRIDPYLKNTTLIDPVSGSAVFYDSRVKVEKV